MDEMINGRKFNIKDSQNFLHNKKLVEELINKSKINKNDLVLEIGAGKGILTTSLIKVCKKVVAIEFDSVLANKLKEEFKNSNVEVVEMDFLNYNLPNENYKVFSNIPFNITASIINKLLDSKNPPTQTFLIMQYEAFLKYAGAPFYKDSFKSLQYKPFFNTNIVHTFSKFDFKPAPNAKIVLAHFLFKEISDIKFEYRDVWRDFLSFIFLENGFTFQEKTRKIFSYKQQKIISNESGITDNLSISNWTYEFWLKIFQLYNSNMVSDDKKSLVSNSYKRMLKHEAGLEKLHRNRKVTRNN
jgi:23S rRNA (adenine-N6)-dimethyltransferase